MKKVTVKIPKILIFIVAFLFCAIIIRLSYIALSANIDGINLHEFVSNRNTKEEVIYAKRGNIYDKDGKALATMVNSYTLIAYLEPSRTTDPDDPQHVIDKEATAKMLNEVLGVDYDKAMDQLNKKAYQVEFNGAKEISESKKNEIEALNMPGIDFIASQKRSYSMGSFASYILGYAKKNEDGDIVGELGIEAAYNDILKGKNGKLTYEADAHGYRLPTAEVMSEEAVSGDEIYLTLDSKIQMFAENVTDTLSKNVQMDWMIFTVMDAKTGAIVASSTYPDFNPNDLNTLKNYVNPLVSYPYEPGSVMKSFSFAASIEEGLYKGDELYKSGTIKVGGATIRDHNNGVGWGENGYITFDEGFANSSNVATSILADRLGVDLLTRYYNNLGFGYQTGIELFNADGSDEEADGVIDFHGDLELATAGFGQGIMVTPIQILQAMTVFSNDGTVLKPYIVDKIVDGNGDIVYQGGRKELNKVYSKETTDYMKNLMYNVVYYGSSGGIWKAKKTTLIGKTGTAQIGSPTGYLTGHYDTIQSFAGMFPQEDPQYIIYVAAEKAHTNSGTIAKEVIKAVDNIASYMGLENENENISDLTINLGNYISSEVTSTVDDLKKKKLKVYTLGSGKYIINQYPLKDMKVLENSKVFIVSNSSDYKMEDVTGWTLNEIMTYANLLKINLEVEGSGYVTSQSISKDTLITKDMTLKVVLKK